MKLRLSVNIWLFTCLLLLLMTPAVAAPRQVMRGHVPAAVARLQPMGNFAGTNHLNLAIGLPLRNQEALTHLLREIYDPASSKYHHYLTPEQFTEMFGPTEQDYQVVIAFAKANSLTVTGTDPTRMLVDVSGSVADIERALHVMLRVYQHPTEKRMFHAPDAEPSLDLAVPILRISGLDNYSLPRPRLQAALLANASKTLPNAGSGPSGTYMGKDFRAAYVPDSSLDGSGQIVGLLQFDGYTASDITYYENQAGLPNITLSNVLIDGATGNPSGSGGEVEVSLDIEMAISMATNLAEVIVYIAPNPSPWEDLLNRMANDNVAKQLSCSWYEPGGAANTNADQIFQKMAAQGQSFFSASGDYDAFTGLIPFPGDTPYITEVGGTTLTTSGPGGSWVSETVWNWGNGIGSGGGISTQYPIPVWQTNINMTTNQGSTTMRNVPDVALTADNVYVRADGQDLDEAGTSCAAPLWAGFMALVNQQAAASGRPPVGFLNPAIYAIGLGAGYNAAFHDITTGNNTSSSSPTKFYAVTGYDLCTGWGTPSGQSLINALANPDALSITPLDGFSSSGGAGGPFTITSQSLSLTNTGTNSLSWSLVNTSLWLNASPSGGTLTPGGVAATVTVSLNTAASNLLVGTYSATVLFTNLNSNYGQSRQFTLSVISPPTITLQPSNQTVLDGASATFTVGISGGLPLYYQWQANSNNLTDGTRISGSATSTMVISNVSPADVANYRVIVTNAAGATVSTNALLTALPGNVDHFTWSMVSSPQVFNAPFAASITARDPAEVTATNFTGTVALAGWTQNGTNASSIVIAEVDTSDNDAIEFANVSGRAVDVSGWQITTYDWNSWPGPGLTFTVPSGTICPAGGVFLLREMGTAPGSYPVFYTGVNIYWNNNGSGNPVALLLRDNTGQIMDFFCAVDANPASITLPTNIPPAQWLGAPVPANLNATPTYQRVGNQDRNTNADWVIGTSSLGLLNTNLNIPFVGGSTPVAITPTNSGNFANGVWSGNITVLQPAINIVLRADDGSGHTGSSNPFDVVVQNDISISIADSPDPISVGANLTYTLTVANTGPSAATGVMVTNILPASTTFMSATASQGTCTQAAGVVTCNLGTIPGGTNATIAIVVVPTTSGTITNVAVVSRAEADPYPANNSATAVTTVQVPALSINDVSLFEGNTGTTNAVFTVSLTPAAALPVSVNFATADGTATAGSDYAGTSGTLNFAPGQTNQTIVVVVNGDTVGEADETFFVNLTSPTNATLARAQGTGTILNDDVPPAVYLRSSAGAPWGSTANETAMNRAFGTNNWQDLRYETVNVAALFSPINQFIFMEGSDMDALEMQAFLMTNITTMQNWVAAGGRLFLNAAPNEGSGMNFGFGVNLVYPDLTATGSAADPLHPIFQGPFLPVGTTWSGTYFGHATVTGSGLVTLITNTANGRVVLAELRYGNGLALFGGMTTPNYHSPAAEAANLRANILAYTATRSLDSLLVSPSDGLVSQGYEGGPFNPSNKVYTLSNGGANALDWSASCLQAWVPVLTNTSPDAVRVIVIDSPQSCRFFRAVASTGGVQPLLSTLSYAAGQFQFTLSGQANAIYIIEALTDLPTQAWWVTVDPSGGSLAPGASTNVTVLINTNACSLSNGVYTATATFHNLMSGTAQERPVSLTVLMLAPNIITQPANQTVVMGGTANFNVTATGAPPLSYQWSFNGTNIVGATNMTLTLTNVQLSQAGNYAVLVTNVFGLVLSSNATLAVYVVPVITSFNPQSGTMGTVVNISGLNFDPTPTNNTVYFGAVQAVVTAASPTNLTVTVPVGATYAPITVTVNGLTAYANQPFMPTFAGDGSGITVSSFAPRFDLASGNGPNKVVIADLDGDGKPDLIVSDDYNDIISIYRNISTNGSLTADSFAPRVDLVTPPGSYSPFGLEVADVDGDGKLDIIISDYDESIVSVYRNTCTPGNISSNSFATRVDFATGAQPQGIAVRDIDGDGKPDLLVANTGDGTVSILRNTGVMGSLTTNSFAPKVDIATGSSCDSVAVGDLDGDGKPDVVAVNNGNGTVSLLRNISSPGSITTNSFAAKVDIAVLSEPVQVAIGDLDGDGKPDLTVTFYLPQTVVAVFRNTSTVGSLTTNSFAPEIDFPLGGRGHTPAIADLDGDGKPDVAVVTELNSLLSIFRNVSTPGSFTNSSLAARVDFSTGYNAWGVAIGDLDGDGRPDIVFANTYDNTISIYQNVVPLGGPPVITTQPANQTVTVGGTATFNVTASGTLPLSYQWSFWGTNILGATNTMLTLTNVQLNQAGNYAVLVTNAYGSVLSSNAVLTAAIPPSVLVIWDAINSNTLALKAALEAAGINVTLSPTDESQYVGTNPDPYAFNAVIHMIGANFSMDMPSAGQTALVGYVQNGGGYLHGGTESAEIYYGRLVNMREAILFDYVSGGSGGITLSVVSGQSGHPVLTNSPSSFDVSTYFFLGSAHVFATNPVTVLMRDNLGDDAVAVRQCGAGRIVGFHHRANDASSYPLLNTNVQRLYLNGVRWAGVALTTNSLVIAHQPQGQTVAVGGNVTFTVAVKGTAPFGYQWSFNGTNLSGATNTLLTLTNVQLGQAGNYAVLVTNVSGSILSSNAVLTVVNPSTPDAFNPGANDVVLCTAVQADGKIVVGGYFSTLGGSSRSYIGRLNADGTLDTGFNPGASGYVSSLAVQADGKILVGGYFTTLGGLSRLHLGRLNADGALDTSFNPGASGTVDSLAVQADGKIVVGGYFTTLGSQTRYNIGRLNIDGTLDTGFNPGANNEVLSLAVQADGKIVVGGWFTTLGGQSRTNIGRLNADGTLDTGFNPGANAAVNSLAVQADGKIVVGGYFATLGGLTRYNIGRLNADGTLDAGFNPGTVNSAVNSLAVQVDGKILVGGGFATLGGQSCTNIGRLNANGTLDTIFNPGVNGNVYSLAVQADGKILLGGYFTTLGGQSRTNIGRLTPTDPATQNLTFDGSTITWLRGGSSPEVWRTFFDGSTNGTTWVSLGTGTRVADGWQLTGLTWPTNATIRARGFVTGGYYNSSGWFVETIFGTTNCPPIITSQPTNQTVTVGGTASFNVVASGTPLLNYQWNFNGTNIVGATNTTLTLTNVQLRQAGNYAVLVTNNYGSALSSNAVLVVGAHHFVWNQIPSPQYAGQPFGVTITAKDAFNVTVSNFNGSVSLAGSGDSQNRMLDGVVPDQSALGTWTWGYSFTPTNDLVVTHVRSYFGTKVSLWTSTGVLLASQNVGTAGTWTETELGTPVTLAAGSNYVVAAYVPDAVYYWITRSVIGFPNGTINQSLFSRIDTFPTNITTGSWPMVGLRYTVGSAAPISITPTNSGNFVNGVWSGNITVLQLATNVVLRADDGSGHTGTSNPFDVLSAFPPVITSQPTNQTVFAGGTATFGVTANGTAPLSYQWNFNGTNILGATNTTLTLTNVQLSQAGNYAVLVTNAYGSVLSSNAVLTVNPPSPGIPVIFGFNPISGIVGAGVTISGTNFSPVPSNNIVYFGAVRAVVTAASVTNLVVTVPAGATYVPITETVNGLVAYANKAFQPTFFGDGSSISSSSFAPRVDLAGGNGPYVMCIADLDGDGKPDLVVANYYGDNISLFRNISTNGLLTTNSFAPRVDLPSLGGAPLGLAAADVDRDGKPDLVVSDSSNNRVMVYRNISTVGTLATNSFAAPVAFSVGNSPGAVRVRDLDRDGRPDIACVCSGDNTLSILRNIGTAGSLTTNSFAPQVTLATGNNPHDLVIADLDGDGKPDLAQINYPRSFLSVFRNVSVQGVIDINSFAARVDFAASGEGDSITAGDVDGDGKVDLVAGWAGGSAIAVYRNLASPGTLGTNSFAAEMDFSAPGWVRGVAMGDLNGDGKPDISLVGESGNFMSVFQNVSTPGSFTNTSLASRVDYGAGLNPHSVVIGDLDGDGRPDVIFVNQYGGNISIYQNVMPFGSAPIITAQPTNQTVTVGGTATFSVTASGSLPLSYQWNFNGTNIVGATNTTLTLTNVQFSQAGNYAVLVANGAGSILSSDAVLTVISPSIPDSFNPGANGIVWCMAVQADGKILVGGGFTTLGGQSRTNIGRLNADGTLDTTFNPGANSWVRSLTVQEDGKILVGGGFTTLGGQSRSCIGRLNANGTIDTTFNPGANDEVSSLAVQSDGKILVGGFFTTLGGQSRWYIGRLNADGTPDTTFNPGASYGVYPLALQADGKILVGGGFFTLGGQSRPYLGRLNTDGTLDTNFNPVVSNYVYSLAVQADGKILVSGNFTNLNGQSRSYIGRLYADGTLDTAFNPEANNRVYSMAVQADGKVLVCGEFTTLGGQSCLYLGRLNSNGTMDTGFSPGANSYVYSLAVQPDGKILVGGNFITLGGQSRTNIGRLTPTDPATQNLTFDGSTITWLRGGSSPEVWRTIFDGSTNGTTWVSLGTGTRVADGWQLTGLTWPTNATIRARGFVTGGLFNGSGWFVETIISPPIITNQPVSQTIAVGGTVTFSVGAGSFVPLCYQWNFNGINISGATNTSLTLTNVQLNQAGNYAVMVTNGYGSVLSSNAVLIVHALDHFTWSPIPAPRFVKTPFSVIIRAQDMTNGLFTNFTGTAILGTTNGVAVTPPVSGNFVQGVWTGSVVISRTASNLVLRADDGLGHFGLANPINVINLPNLWMLRSGNIALYMWPVGYTGFVLETSGSLSPAAWVVVPYSPIQIGDQYLLPLDMSGTNGFYRLWFPGP